MYLNQALMEQKEHEVKHRISRLQRDRDCGVITDLEYEERYEIVMAELRQRFGDLMDGQAERARKDFLDTEGFGF